MFRFETKRAAATLHVDAMFLTFILSPFCRPFVNLLWTECLYKAVNHSWLGQAGRHPGLTHSAPPANVLCRNDPKKMPLVTLQESPWFVNVQHTQNLAVARACQVQSDSCQAQAPSLSFAPYGHALIQVRCQA